MEVLAFSVSGNQLTVRNQNTKQKERTESPRAKKNLR